MKPYSFNSFPTIPFRGNFPKNKLHTLMKEKILAALKTKFNGVQNAILDRIADHLATTVTEEAQIETAVNGVAGLIPTFSQLLQSEGDRRVTEATKKVITDYEKQHNLKEGKPIEAPKPPDPNDVATIVANAVNAAVKPLQEKLQSFEQKGNTDVLTSKLKAKMAEKKIPEHFMKGRTIESEEKLDSVLAEIVTDYDATKQHFINEGVVVEKPMIPGGPTEKVDQSIKEWANKDKKTNT